MGILSIVEVAIGLLEGIVAQTGNKTDDLVVAGVKAALGELKKVHGTVVTQKQLQELRVTPRW